MEMKYTPMARSMNVMVKQKNSEIRPMLRRREAMLWDNNTWSEICERLGSQDRKFVLTRAGG